MFENAYVKKPSSLVSLMIILLVLFGFTCLNIPAYAETEDELAERFVNIALNEFTATDNLYGNKYSNYFGNSNAAWCGYFIMWCADQCGAYGSYVKDIAWTPNAVYYYGDRWIERNQGYIPQKGDLALIDWNARSTDISAVDRIQHIELVYKCDGSTIYTIGGNRGTSASSYDGIIKKSTFPINSSYVVGYAQFRSANYHLYNRPLSKGMTGNDVRELQQHLINLNYDLGTYGADGDFGITTEARVKDFQRDHGLNVTGIFDQSSYDTLVGILNILSDKQLPTISNVRVSDISPSGYTVTCDVSDNVGVDRVAFPTWTMDNDQDDIFPNWSRTALGTLSNGTAVYRVNTSEHGGQNGCTYITHIYVYDAAGNQATDGTTIWVPAPDNENPTISNITVTDISPNGYTVYCDVADNQGVVRVAFPTWTEKNGQDDIIWHEGELSGNRATCFIHTVDHGNEVKCRYITHIYAYDAQGNSVREGIAVDIPPIPGKPVLSVINGTSLTSTEFNWSAAEDADEYHMYLFTESMDVIKSLGIYSTNELSASMILPAGTYKVQIAALHTAVYGDTTWSDPVTVQIPAPKEIAVVRNRSVWTEEFETLRDNFNVYAVFDDFSIEVDDYYIDIPYYSDGKQSITIHYGELSTDIDIVFSEEDVRAGNLISRVMYENTIISLYENDITWFEANMIAHASNSQLVTIKNQEKQNIVKALVQSYSKSVWIGAYENDSSRWVWVTDDEMVFSNWGEGQPDKHRGIQNKGIMLPNGDWDDVTNNIANGYIIEKAFEPDLSLPLNLVVVEKEAFRQVPASVIKCNEELEEIESLAFANCSNLTEIYIPANVVTIARTAFEGCSPNLTIFGKKSSVAESFAKACGYQFVEAIE